MVKTSVFETLEILQLASIETRKLFNNRTRDKEPLNVWIDELSKVIYIDDFYTGDDTYKDGSYRVRDQKEFQVGKSSFEETTDVSRRFDSSLPFVSDKKVMEFGCGSGDYLRLIKPHCTELVGIELQQDFVDILNNEGIRCVSNLDKINDDSIDICVSFHVIEHLPNPLDVLNSIRKKLICGGHLLIEVPHANDFLLSACLNEEFKQFTLWSQHLILHTRESLHRMLNYVGFTDIYIEGIQRYPLSNHLNWLVNGEPGGHKSHLSLIDSTMLKNAYAKSLARLDATDTLLAIAKVP